MVALLTVCLLGLLVTTVAMMILIPGFYAAKRRASRGELRRNLVQIGWALHTYHDIHGTFPPSGTFSPNGEPRHSWQTLILPGLEQSSLYAAIDQSVGWEAPANHAAFCTAVPIYFNPNYTWRSDRVRLDGLALSHFAINTHLAGPNRGMKLSQISDGTAQTILAGEMPGGFLPWADPANSRDPALGLGQAPTQFGSASFATHFLMADGSVSTIDNTVSPTVMQAISTPAGGEAAVNF